MTEVKANQWFPAALEAFSSSAVPDEVSVLNAAIIARLSEAPDIWSYPLPDIRKARAQGRGAFPLRPADPAAAVRFVPGRGAPIRVREIAPHHGAARGTYLHIHGGGWVMGTPEENDWHLRRIADATGLRTVSVDYRLAPEDPWPASADDCEDAALALLQENTDPRHAWLIGGESAGAHLSAVTLLRLRDRHAMTPFRAANLVAGCFDLALTPSVRNWGDVKLILRTRDVVNFVERLLPQAGLAETADVSPLRANLAGLPPALFSCGTLDLLIDDSMMMAGRWHAAGNAARLSLWPGGCHVFQHFDTGQAEESLAEIERFLAVYAT
ncbi:MAG: alpha/beta hydrolase [Rhizobiaceae bacterium]|jgi:acetyl esterase/lipase|nr:alpha/beta hydrolase [Rhizobiaceae bacterium]